MRIQSRPRLRAQPRPLLAFALAATLAAAPGHVAADDDPMLDWLQSHGHVQQHARGHVPAVAADTAAAPAPAVGGAVGGAVLLAALNFLDTPYRLGGQHPDGFDCSGFTRHVYALALGLELPRSAAEQARATPLQAVDGGALEAGDLVFFNTRRAPHSHVGIYLGDRRFVHAPRAGAQVRVESIDTPYWARRFDGARRAVLAVAETAPTQP